MTSSDWKIQRLTEDNYFTWVVEAEAALCLKGLWGAVEEDSEFLALDANQKKKKQREARGFLILCISPLIRERIVVTDTPKKIWEGLQSRFCQTTTERKASLVEQLTRAEQKSGESVATFIGRVETLQRRLLEGHSETVSDDILVGILLKGVASKFQQTIEALRCMDTLTLRLVKDKLIAADDRMRNAAGRKEDDGGAYQARGHEKRGSGQQKNGGRRRCYNCGKVGHMAKNCWHRDKTPKGKEEDSGAALTAHAHVNTSDVHAHSEKLLYDTGATHHMCFQRSKFHSIRPSEVPFVNTGGGERHEVLGQGTICVQGSNGVVRLQDTLFVPTLTANLFSGSAAFRHGARISGMHGVFEVILKGRTVLKAIGQNGLFEIQGSLLSPVHDELKVPQMGIANVTATADLWHKRLGHVAFGTLRRMHNCNALRNFKVVDAIEDQKTTCKACVEGKQGRLPFPSSASVTTRPLELVHADVVGKMPCASVGGSLWVLTIMDDYSRYGATVCTRSKADVGEAFWKVLRMWERQTSQKVKTVRTDGGTEFLGFFASELSKAGIIHQTSTRYTPQQNGRAERFNRTLFEKARCIMFEADMPSTFWAEAVSTATYLHNITLAKHSEKTPQELFLNTVPDAAMLKVVGCSAHVQIPKQLRGKLDKRSVHGILVGFEEHKKAWRVMVPVHHGWKLYVSRDVLFDEATKGIEAVKSSARDQALEDGFDIGAWYSNAVEDSGEDNTQQGLPLGGENSTPQACEEVEASIHDEDVAHETNVGAEEIVQEEASTEASACAGDTRQDEAYTEDDDDDAISRDSGSWDLDQDTEQDVIATIEREANNDANQPDANLRRSARESVPPKRYEPGSARVHIELRDEPQSVREIQSRPDAELWLDAMRAELAALCEKGVYEWAILPAHKRALPARWVFKIKRDERGAIEKYKARLVAKGFLQKPGEEYTDVFAPASSHVTLRLLLSVAAERNLDIHQLDVKTAFLNGDLTEEVYLKPPEGFEDKAGHVWRLKKALYGLKQAAQAWHDKLKSKLSTIGFKASSSDPTLFISGSVREEKTYMLVHVDDVLILGTSAAVRAAKASFLTLFEARDLGDAAMFLGLQIQRDKAAGTIWLGQSHYTAQIVQQYGLSEGKSKITPFHANQQLAPTGTPLQADVPYSAAVGSLLYLAVCTRPDISHSVGMLSRFVGDPKSEHWQALKGVIRYLKGTIDLGLMYRRGGGSIMGYTDSDYAGDLVKRRSTSGFVFINAGAAILWGSKLQTIIAVSTCEAELVAGARAIKEGLWLRKLWADLHGKSITMPILMDNQSALTLLKNPAAGAQTRTKHIDINYNFARHRHISGDITAKFVPTDEMLADVFTKQLPGPAYRKHRDHLGLTCRPL